MGFPTEPEQVDLLLKRNPSFARVCGFAPKQKDKTKPYSYRQVPSLRKLEQLDQQGIALDAVAIRDAATHDGQTFYPHVEKVFDQNPELTSTVERVL